MKYAIYVGGSLFLTAVICSYNLMNIDIIEMIYLFVFLLKQMIYTCCVISTNYGSVRLG